MKKRMFLFACIEKNIGDDLFVYIIANRYRNVDFIITKDASYLKSNNLPNLIYSKRLKYWLRIGNVSTNCIIKDYIASFLLKIISISFKKYDAVYIVGNAFKNNNYQGNYQLNWLYNRLKISKTFYLLSTNFGPTNDDRWINDCGEIYKLMTDVCFRDLDSFNKFKNNKNVRYAPDAVISMAPIIRSNSKKNNKYVIVSVIDCSLQERGKRLNDCCNIFETKIVEIINYFNNQNINVVLLNSNAEQDCRSSDRIFSKCLRKDSVSIFNYNGCLHDVFELYSNAFGVVATRLHTIILSWIYNIPVFPIIYDIKVENILKSYHFSGNSVKIDNLDYFDISYIEYSFKNYSFKITAALKRESNNQFAKLDDYLLGDELNEK